MTLPLHIFEATSADATSQLAVCIGAHLERGDILLLEGDIGAGKTHFARGLIRSLQDSPEDIPSPTFTLIQTYDTTAGEIWHADLYRLTGPDEIYETGLYDAMEDAICIIEWPDRLGSDAPEKALMLRFEQADQIDARRITFTSQHSDAWRKKLETCFE